MKDPEKEYTRDIRIDPEALDIECTRQAEAFIKWAERSVLARGQLERLKTKIGVVKAKLSLDCRKTPESFGIEGRVTDASIDAAVTIHPKMLSLQRKIHTARDTSAMLDRVVDAMESKRKMLDDLIILHGQEYFAGPKVPRNLGKIWKSQQEHYEGNITARQVSARRKRKDEHEDA